MSIDSLRTDYPAPEPCSTVYCRDVQTELDCAHAAIGKLLGLLHTSMVEVNDADRLYRKHLSVTSMGGGVRRYSVPPLAKEASS